MVRLLIMLAFVIPNQDAFQNIVFISYISKAS